MAAGSLNLSASFDLICSQIHYPENQDYHEQLRQLTNSIPLYDEVQSSILSSPLHTMRLKVDPTFVKDMDQYLYNKAPNLSSKAKANANTTAMKFESQPELIMNMDEAVYTFSVYKANDSALQQEIELLGSNSLMDLAEAIYCVGKSECYKSTSASSDSFFFVKGAFYGDDRQQSSASSSSSSRCSNSKIGVVSNVVSWMKSVLESDARSQSRYSKKRRMDSTADSSTPAASVAGDLSFGEWLSSLGIADVDSIPVRTMQSTAVRDIPSWKLASRYLYCHSGCCEHTFVLTGLRQVHPSLDGTEQQQCKYPRVTYQKKNKRKCCTVCDANSAKFLVSGDRLAEVNPCYYCE